MSRIAYVNGRYLPHAEATVSIDDRGFVFADGVYEVIAVQGGRLVDEPEHLVRLKRSLGELRIAAPMADKPLGHVMRRVVKLNQVRNGMIYLQITRGAAPRDHAFPTRPVTPLLMVTAKRLKPIPAQVLENGIAVVTIPDLRWRRCDIKSVSLLPNIMGKQHAREAGAYEAWQVDEAGMVTEGTSSNAWIVSAEGVIVTRPLGNDILRGITRTVLKDLAAELGMGFEERAFSVEEAKSAREAFLTSTTSHVMPVTRIDGVTIGNGKTGSFTQRLGDRYRRHLDTGR